MQKDKTCFFSLQGALCSENSSTAVWTEPKCEIGENQSSSGMALIASVGAVTYRLSAGMQRLPPLASQTLDI